MYHNNDDNNASSRTQKEATFSTNKDAQQTINSSNNNSEETVPMNDEIVKRCDKCLKRIQIYEICEKCKNVDKEAKENCFDCIKLRNQIIINLKICNNCNKPLERRRRRQNLRNQAHSLVGKCL